MKHGQKFDIKPNTDLFRKQVEQKLITTIKKYTGARNFSIDTQTMRDMNELGKLMGISRKGGCQLTDFRSHTKNAKDEHISALDGLIDHINKGMKAANEFGKHRL